MRLHSADGRCRTELGASYQLGMFGTTGVPKDLYIYGEWEALSTAEAQELGFSGLKVADQELSLSLETLYEWNENSATGGGMLSVYGSETRLDCLAWPTGSEYYDQRCRQPPLEAK